MPGAPPGLALIRQRRRVWWGVPVGFLKFELSRTGTTRAHGLFSIAMKAESSSEGVSSEGKCARLLQLRRRKVAETVALSVDQGSLSRWFALVVASTRCTLGSAKADLPSVASFLIPAAA